MAADFAFPAQLDYLAIFAWALSGAVIGLRKRYDIVGVFTIAMLSSIGGGIIRDGVLLQRRPPVLVEPYYLPLIVLATVLAVAFRYRLVNAKPIGSLVNLIDAAATPAFAVVGMQVALKSGIPVPGVLLIGCVSGLGGGVLRDIVVREVPEILQPGHFLAIPLVIACGLFLAVTLALHAPPVPTAWATVIGFFVVRALTVKVNWRTSPLLPDGGSAESPPTPAAPASPSTASPTTAPGSRP
jgi:uncharacterized membrane protein YeiH